MAEQILASLVVRERKNRQSAETVWTADTYQYKNKRKLLHPVRKSDIRMCQLRIGGAKIKQVQRFISLCSVLNTLENGTNKFDEAW